MRLVKRLFNYDRFELETAFAHARRGAPALTPAAAAQALSQLHLNPVRREDQNDITNILAEALRAVGVNRHGALNFQSFQALCMRVQDRLSLLRYEAGFECGVVVGLSEMQVMNLWEAFHALEPPQEGLFKGFTRTTSYAKGDDEWEGLDSEEEPSKALVALEIATMPTMANGFMTYISANAPRPLVQVTNGRFLCARLAERWTTGNLKKALRLLRLPSEYVQSLDDDELAPVLADHFGLPPEATTCRSIGEASLNSAVHRFIALAMPRPPIDLDSPKLQEPQSSKWEQWENGCESPFGQLESEDAHRMDHHLAAPSPLALEMRLQHEAVMQKLSLQESMLREVLRRPPQRDPVARVKTAKSKEIIKPAPSEDDRVENAIQAAKANEPESNEMNPNEMEEPVHQMASKKSVLVSYSSDDLDKKQSAFEIHSRYLRNSFLTRGFKVRRMESCVQWLVKHQLFEAFFALVVVSNSIFIGIEVARSIEAPRAPRPLAIQVIQYTYTTLFTTELVLRIIAYGTKFCISEDWMWAVLDIFIVASSLWEVAVDIIQAVYEQESDLDGMTAFMNMKTFRIIRLTRLLKTIQFVKIFRFVMALRMLVTSIMSTLKALFWALVLLILVVYVFGVLFAQAVNDHLLEHDLPEPEIERATEPEKTEAGRYFGSLEQSMLSLFMSIAGGVSWEQVIFPLKKISTFWVFAFVFYIAFTYFAVLNVLTGVFCQSAIESANNDHAMVVQSMLDNKASHLAKIKTLFDELGTENHGILTIGMFEDKINDPAVREYFEALGLDVWDAWSFFKLLDEDGGGSVEIEEFFLGCLRFRGPARSMDVGRLLQDQKWLIKSQGRAQHYMEDEFQSLRAEIKKMQTLLKAAKPHGESSD
eukprot:symbB.v1.2.030087.t1/scaffold3353.1/size58589/7